MLIEQVIVGDFHLTVSELSGWISGVNPWLVDVFGYDSSGSDDDAIADIHGKNGGVAADGDLVADFGWYEERAISRCWASVLESVVDEHDAAIILSASPASA